MHASRFSLVVVASLSAASLSSSCASSQAASLAALSAVPAQDAPLGEREAWLREHKPLDHIGARALVLQSGAQVSDVHALLGSVDGDSATARAVAAADDAEALQQGITIASSVGLALGFGAMFASPLLLIDQNAPQQTEASLALLASGTVLAIGAALGLSFAEEQATEVEVQRSAAMITWESDTRRRLGVDAAASPVPLSDSASEGERGAP